MFKLLTLVALVGPAIASHLVRAPTARSQPAERQCEIQGPIAVIDSTSGIEYGFISGNIGGGGFMVDPDYFNGMPVIAPCAGPDDDVGQIALTDMLYPYLAIGSICSTEGSSDIGTGSANYLLVTLGPETDVGGVPVARGCPSGESSWYATGIWSVTDGEGSSLAIGVTWVNSDGSTPSNLTVFYWQGPANRYMYRWVGITGDWDLFSAQYASAGPIYQVDLFVL